MTHRDVSVVLVSVLLAPLAKMIEFAAVPAVGGPDFLAILSVCVGWSCDLWTAVPAGFAIGLIEDVVTARALGSRAVSLALAAAAVAGIRRVINPDSLSSKVIAALGGTTLADIINWAILSSFGIRIASSYFARTIWIPSALWSALLIGPVDALVRRVAAGIRSFWPSSGRKGRETAV